MIQLKIKTNKRKEVINITRNVREAVKQNNWKGGTLFIFLPHCTATLIVNEYESAINEDYLRFFEKLSEGKWKHGSVGGNAHAHLINSLVGAGKFFFVENSELQLGTWQSILLVELDGPRERMLQLKFLPDK